MVHERAMYVASTTNRLGAPIDDAFAQALQPFHRFGVAGARIFRIDDNVVEMGVYIEAALASAQDIIRQNFVFEDIVVGLGTDEEDGGVSMIIKIGLAAAQGERLDVGVRHIRGRDTGVDLVFDLGMGSFRVRPLERHRANFVG